MRWCAPERLRDGELTAAADGKQKESRAACEPNLPLCIVYAFAITMVEVTQASPLLLVNSVDYLFIRS